MSKPNESGIEIGEEELSTDLATVIVTDSEDYSKTQKLKSIQEAKEHYRRFTTRRTERHNKMTEQFRFPSEVLANQEAEALALYASELLPLIDQAIQKGTLSEADLRVETDSSVNNSTRKDEMSIRELVRTLGRIPTPEGIEQPTSDRTQPLDKSFQLKMYRRLEHIETKLGLGIELEENKGPAEI